VVKKKCFRSRPIDKRTKEGRKNTGNPPPPIARPARGEKQTEGLKLSMGAPEGEKKNYVCKDNTLYLEERGKCLEGGTPPLELKS